MGNRKAKMLDTGMRVDSNSSSSSTADLQVNGSDRHLPLPSHANRNRLRASEQDLTSLSIREGKQFEAVNLDENGKFVQFGILEIAPAEIVFHRVPNKELVETNRKASEERIAKAKLLQPTNSLRGTNANANAGAVTRETNRRDVASIHWPFYLLREYGYNQDLFIVETGRRACTGAGIFAFHTSNATELFRSLQEAIKQYSIKLSKEQPAKHNELFDGNGSTADLTICSPQPANGDESVSTISASASASALAFDAEQENLPKHNYVNLNLTEKKLSSDHEYKTLRTDNRDDADDRKYENLPRVEEQRITDACYVNVNVNVTPPRDSDSQCGDSAKKVDNSRHSEKQRDANGHLPGCPCHQKVEYTKPKNKDSAADSNVQLVRQLNYIEVCPKKNSDCILHEVVVRADNATSDSESSATLSQSTTQTTLASLTNAPSSALSVFSLDANDGASASRPPSRTNSSVFSANGKLVQTDTEYTKIDLIRTEALKMSIQTFEDPRPSFVQELSRNKGSVDSMTGYSASHPKEKHTHAENDNLRLSPAALAFSNASPKVAKMLVIGMFKRSRRKILQIFS